MLNRKQVDLSEKVLVNSANVVLVSLIFGGVFSSKGFNLISVILGCILFTGIILGAFRLRKGDDSQ